MGRLVEAYKVDGQGKKDVWLNYQPVETENKSELDVCFLFPYSFIWVSSPYSCALPDSDSSSITTTSISGTCCFCFSRPVNSSRDREYNNNTDACPTCCSKPNTATTRPPSALCFVLKLGNKITREPRRAGQT